MWRSGRASFLTPFGRVAFLINYITALHRKKQTVLEILVTPLQRLGYTVRDTIFRQKFSKTKKSDKMVTCTVVIHTYSTRCAICIQSFMPLITSSSDVAKRPRDVSCLSVVSRPRTKHRAQSFIVSYIGYRFIIAYNVVLLSLA